MKGEPGSTRLELPKLTDGGTMTGIGAKQGAALTLERLQAAVAEDAAVRFVARLQPVGGLGDKVFPPTYTGGQYALESRVDEHGVVKEVVLLDSVQSQANRMEQALLAAHRDGRIALPMISVSFSKVEELKELGEITVLDAPHRLADAILRDSMLNGTLFPATTEGQVLRRATAKNATELFKLCPTALLFGIWESTGAAGGLGVKFQRAIVSEIIGVGAVVGRKTASRIDPLQVGRVPIYEARERADGGIPWTADESKALADGTNPDGTPRYKRFKVSSRAKGVPSEVNHGNVTPDTARHRGEMLRLGRDLAGEQRVIRDRDELPGGVTLEYAKHTAVLSLAALRRLHFPIDGGADASPVARLVLAALGLFALIELRRNDYDLRSRCALVLEGAPAMEIVKRDGVTEPVSLDGRSVKALLDEARQHAEAKKLIWRKQPLELTPSTALRDLIVQSRRIGIVETDGEEDAEAEPTGEDAPAED
ncbi:MAG TPA: type I-U CRISPR-associated RAMP protein Csb1/Cas7u [Anaeromyxobacter sp.]|nr:type I-U CRISPR-associated RAMP protein Csb1/Cas7u [Anaeromyxobacter sp.]